MELTNEFKTCIYTSGQAVCTIDSSSIQFNLIPSYAPPYLLPPTSIHRHARGTRRISRRSHRKAMRGECGAYTSSEYRAEILESFEGGGRSHVKITGKLRIVKASASLFVPQGILKAYLTISSRTDLAIFRLFNLKPRSSSRSQLKIE